MKILLPICVATSFLHVHAKSNINSQDWTLDDNEENRSSFTNDNDFQEVMRASNTARRLVGICEGTEITCNDKYDCPKRCNRISNNAGDVCTKNSQCPPNREVPRKLRGKCRFAKDSCALPPLTYVSETSNALGNCEGDCDHDGHCDWGLNCFQRSGTTPVPGCSGDGLSDKDYCYIPPTGELVLVGDDWEPQTSFPLGECEGDCDSDDDCEEGLVCSQRSGTEQVPGCTGIGYSGKDYCYSPTQPPLSYVSDTSSTLGNCEGDCDHDGHCDWGLNCFQRSGTTPVPGCLGEGITDTDYCYIPLAGELVYAGDDWEPQTSFPLGECEGDCDSDDDCEEGLVCFQRSGTEQVPGCTGTGYSGKDYCYNPAQPPLTYVSDTSSTLGNCEGDCDHDGHCDWGLNCFQRSGTTPVPGCSGDGEADYDYCYIPRAKELVYAGDDWEPQTSFPLGECEGDCDSDDDCEDGLVCFQRSSTEHVPGCIGTGYSGKDYCYSLVQPPPSLSYVSDTSSTLGNCEGDCDHDGHCDWGLNCFQRSGTTPVPGCLGEGITDTDYCYIPLAGELVYAGDDWEPQTSFPLGECEGDCDSDDDCEEGLVCFQRSGTEQVPGCTGTGYSGKDYCYSGGPAPSPPPTSEIVFPNSLTIADCSTGSSCHKCEGNCNGDNNNCASGLECFTRNANEAVPGCVTGGSGDVSGTDYCYAAPSNGEVTYIPGEATVYENGLLLSTGLQSRIIATTGQPVEYETGGQSSQTFHRWPDGAAVFEDNATGGWIYVSNAESTSGGGVGALYFDSAGRVINYQWLLGGTTWNCGGGKTFWDTWLTCEETSTGQVWEVDPWGVNPPRKTLLGGSGAEYESAAYDNRVPTAPKFYVTTDTWDGAIVRFTPDSEAVAQALDTDNFTNLLHTNQTGTAKLEYLVMTPDSLSPDIGSFAWTSDRSEAQNNAAQNYPNSEGIDIRDGKMFITCKVPKKLFILDLDLLTYERSSTETGAFNSQPDQVARILDNEGILYFCEDGGDDSGVHGRDSDGNFYTILADGGDMFGGETTGLAFSPDNMHMYVSFQSPGHIFDITRTDGYPFNGQRLDIKYHAQDNIFAFA